MKSCPLPRIFRFLHYFLLFTFYNLLPAEAAGHPVPRLVHDRTITIRLTESAVVVDYRLEVDEFTVVFVDLPAVLEAKDMAKLTTPAEFYDAYTRIYAPIIADNLIAMLNGRSLSFRCLQRERRLKD